MTADKPSIGGKLILPLLIGLSFVLVVLVKIGAVFVMLALVPSVVAYYIDRNPHLTTLKIVLCCNCAAMLPAIYPMLKAGLMFEPFNSYAVVTDPMNWLIAYSGAAVGWCLIFLCSFVARFMVALAYEYQIRALEQSQKNLLKEWGKDMDPSYTDS